MKRKAEVSNAAFNPAKRQKQGKNELKVLSWNIEDLGGGVSGRPKRRPEPIIDNIATILYEQMPDVIVIQEVLNKAKHGKSDPTDSLFKYIHIPSRSQHVRLAEDRITSFNREHEDRLCTILDTKDPSRLGTKLTKFQANVQTRAYDCFMPGEILDSFNERMATKFSSYIDQLQPSEEVMSSEPTENSNLGKKELTRIYNKLLSKITPTDNKKYEVIAINEYTKNEAYGIIYNSNLLRFSQSNFINIYSAADKSNCSARMPIKIRFQLKNSRIVPCFDIIAWHAPSSNADLRNRAISNLKTKCNKLKLGKPNIPIIIAGDFNTEANELEALYDIRDISHRSSSPPTCVRQHSTGSVVENAGTNSNRKKNFDHIFLANNADGKLIGKTGHKSVVLDATGEHISTHRADRNSLSNHYPIYSIFLY